MELLRRHDGGIWLLVAVLTAGISSCGLLGGSDAGSAEPAGDGEAEVAEPANQVIGEVAAVYGTEGFVLIRRYGGRSLPQDVVFNTSGPGGRTASIRPTGERSGRFYAADITDGEPRKGDVVLARRLPGGALEVATPTPEPRKSGFLPP